MPGRNSEKIKKSIRDALTYLELEEETKCQDAKETTSEVNGIKVGDAMKRSFPSMFLNLSKKGKQPMKRKKKIYRWRVCALGENNQTVPSKKYLETLSAAGLGLKEITLEDNSMMEFFDGLVKNFPRLCKAVGNIVILRRVGNKSALAPLPAGPQGYHSQYLITNGFKESTQVYVAPLLPLDMSPMTHQEMIDMGSEMIDCVLCGLPYPVPLLANHHREEHAEKGEHVTILASPEKRPVKRRRKAVVKMADYYCPDDVISLSGSDTDLERYDINAVPSTPAGSQSPVPSVWSQSSVGRQSPVPSTSAWRPSSVGRQSPVPSVWSQSSVGRQSPVPSTSACRQSPVPSTSACRQSPVPSTSACRQSPVGRQSPVPSTSVEYEDISRLVEMFDIDRQRGEHLLNELGSIELVIDYLIPQVSDNMTSEADSVRAALIQEYAEEVEIKLNVTDDFETCARKILQLYKSNRINYSAPVAVTFKGDPAIGDGVKRDFFTKLRAWLSDGFPFDIVQGRPNVSTCIFAGEPQRRSLEQSASLYSVGAYKIVGRMIGHMFINRAPPIPYVSPVVNALIKNENPEQYVQLEDLRDYALRAEIKQYLDTHTETRAQQKNNTNGVTTTSTSDEKQTDLLNNDEQCAHLSNYDEQAGPSNNDEEIHLPNDNAPADVGKDGSVANDGSVEKDGGVDKDGDVGKDESVANDGSVEKDDGDVGKDGSVAQHSILWDSFVSAGINPVHASPALVGILIQHEVTHKQQRYASQIRDGLLETGITQQQLGCVVDAMLVSSHKVDRHSFLKRIKEKTPLTTNVRRFFYNAIEQLDDKQLSALLTFWTGWDSNDSELLYVYENENRNCLYPIAHVCAYELELPTAHLECSSFADYFVAALNSVGFGLM